MRPIHPFPARMAPEIALKAISRLPVGAKVLDPMTGSGTVLREAVLQGHEAIGYDLDPLAVMITKVWTTPINLDSMSKIADNLLDEAQKLKSSKIYLPWIDDDQETIDFVDYWFSNPQKNDLRKISFLLNQYEQEGINKNVLNALRLALSRIIITKKVGASLAWDISHSRPHKARDENDYDVMGGYKASIQKLKKQLVFDREEIGAAKVTLGDARNLRGVKDKTIDAVITSPPYLNAIDYLRGHKFSLIWFGRQISEIRDIRSTSIGAERACKIANENEAVLDIRNKIIHEDDLPSSQVKMIDRYVGDAIKLMSEVSRVLAKDGKAILVVGNSCLKGVYIKNSDIFKHAGKMFGLNIYSSVKRELPTQSRYLPMPKGTSAPLGGRMRYEIVQTFVN